MPGVEDSGEWLEVEDVSVRMMRGRERGASELGTAVVTIPHSGDSGLGPGGEPGPGGGSWPDMLHHDNMMLRGRPDHLCGDHINEKQ